MWHGRGERGDDKSLGCGFAGGTERYVAECGMWLVGRVWVLLWRCGVAEGRV